jgi:hypothetical protein
MSRSKTTIYLDSDLAEALKEKTGMSISSICRLAMEMFASHEMDDVTFNLKLSMLDVERQNLLKQREHCNIKLEELDELTDGIKFKYGEIKKRNRMQGLIQHLNGELITFCYDSERINMDNVREIIEMNPDFDLVKHIERFKKIVEQ